MLNENENILVAAGDYSVGKIMGWNWSKRWDEVKDLSLGGNSPFISCLDYEIEVEASRNQGRRLFTYVIQRPIRHGPLGFVSWIIPKHFDHAMFYEVKLAVDNYQIEGVSSGCYFPEQELSMSDWTDEKFLAEYPHLAYSS